MSKYLAPAPKFQAFDNNGVPISGGKVYTYESGASTVPLATYTDAGGGTSNSNPVTLDSRGEANIWFTPGVLYRVVLKDATATTTYYTIDNVAGSVTPSAYFATIMGDTTRAQVFDDVVAPGGTITGTITMSGAAINEAASVTVASATSTPVGAAASNNVTVSGVSTITSFDNVAAGIIRYVTFSGILTLTYNATSMILPGATSITTAVGDAGLFQSLGSGNWKCLVYQRQNGTALVTGSSIATQAEMETATNLTNTVTPGRAQYHPGVAKAWAQFSVATGVVTVNGSHNVTSIVRNGTGDYTLTFTTAFSSVIYCALITLAVTPASAKVAYQDAGHAPTTTAFRFLSGDSASATAIDVASCYLAFFGDQ